MLLQSLYQRELAGTDPQDIEAQFAARHDLEKVDAAYYRELLHAIPAALERLDAAYHSFLDRRAADLDPISLSILRIAAFELLEKPELPFKVVINEAVRLAHKFGPEGSHRFVNAVADKLAPKPHKKSPKPGVRDQGAQAAPGDSPLDPSGD